MSQEMFLKDILPIVATITIGILGFAFKALGSWLKGKTKNETLITVIDVSEKILNIAVTGTAQGYVSAAQARGQWGDAEKKEALRLSVEAYKNLYLQEFGKPTKEADALIEHKVEGRLGTLKAEGML